jgi:hypothetical protein
VPVGHDQFMGDGHRVTLLHGGTHEVSLLLEDEVVELFGPRFEEGL